MNFQESITKISTDECREHVHHLIYKEIDTSGSSPVLEKLFQQYSSNFLTEEFQCIFRTYSGNYIILIITFIIQMNREQVMNFH